MTVNDLRRYSGLVQVFQNGLAFIRRHAVEALDHAWMHEDAALLGDRIGAHLGVAVRIGVGGAIFRR